MGLYSGFTPLIRARRLGEALGVDELYVKDDSVNHPTFSYKDRVVSVAISKAIEFGYETVSCASTGNLANSVSAHAASAGLNCYVFIPEGLEEGKIVGSAIYGPRTVAIKGTYDDVNRLCSEIGDKYQWAFVNVNLRPYYSEGAKTHAFEVAEQLGWKLPRHIVVGSAGGTILPKLGKGFKELRKVGLVDPDEPCSIYSAQAAGCSPIINALKRGTDVVDPVKPDTIATSIAIGNPADGYYVIQTLKETGGWGENVTDEEILDGIRLAGRHRGHLHRARRRHRGGGDEEAHRAGTDPAGRVHRHLHHRERLQDHRDGGAHRRPALQHRRQTWAISTSCTTGWRAQPQPDAKAG